MAKKSSGYQGPAAPFPRSQIEPSSGARNAEKDGLPVGAVIQLRRISAREAAGRLVSRVQPCHATQAVISNASVWDTVKMLPVGLPGARAGPCSDVLWSKERKNQNLDRKARAGRCQNLQSAQSQLGQASPCRIRLDACNAMLRAVLIASQGAGPSCICTLD